MELTVKFIIGMCIIGMIGALIIGVCEVNGIKPDFFKYKANDYMDEITKGNNKYVLVGELDDRTTLDRIGEKFSLMVGRKLDNTEDFDVYQIDGRDKKDYIAVELKSNGKMVLFANPELVENPQEIDEEFYDKRNENDINIPVDTIIEWDELNEDTQKLIILTGAGIAFYYAGLPLLGIN